MALLRTVLRSPAASLPALRATAAAFNGVQKSRNLSYVPVDDLVNGLTEEQIQVTWAWGRGMGVCITYFKLWMQFRETIRKFCDAELAPFADQIDHDNGWDQFRPFWKKLGDMGLHGITAPGELVTMLSTALGFTSIK